MENSYTFGQQIGEGIEGIVRFVFDQSSRQLQRQREGVYIVSVSLHSLTTPWERGGHITTYG